jgi:hypothetical protein
MKVVVEREMPADLIEGFYGVYREAFEPLRTRAAARHVLTAEEFAEEMVDARVDKYVVYDRDRRAVALTTFTDDLRTVPWIEPAYYAARFPEQAARNAIFYLGFTLVHPDHQGGPAFSLTLVQLVRRMVASGGVCAYDICAYNDTVRSMGAGIEAAVTAMADVTIVGSDTQTYYTAEFHARASH